MIVLESIDGPFSRPYNDRYSAGDKTWEVPAPVLASYNLVVTSRNKRLVYWAEVRRGPDKRPEELQIDWADELSDLFTEHSLAAHDLVNQAIMEKFSSPERLITPVVLG